MQSSAEEYKNVYREASIVAKRDFNVDDLMTGNNDLDKAIKLQQQMIELCKKGNFQLHKWCANHPALLEAIPKTKQEASLDLNAETTETKALGMKWIPKSDIFMLAYKPQEHKKITKRTVLSETAQLFDPLVIVNPVIVLAKVFLQELWELKLDWDAALPVHLHTKWQNFREELAKLNEVKISRSIVIQDAVKAELHVFADASERAYGSVTYLRSENEKGQVKVSLVCAKSRVAPVSKISLPRLELFGGVVAVELANKLGNALGMTLADTTYWTDSEVTLNWICSEKHYKTFVENRVASVKRCSKVKDWRYVNTKLNPADVLSRGMLPSALLKCSLWWKGPSFLQTKRQYWPENKFEHKTDPSEEKRIKTVLTITAPEDHFLHRVNHRNSLKTLIRTVAYVMRMYPKGSFGIVEQLERPRKTFELSISELKAATVLILRQLQKECFSEEIKLVKMGKGDKTKFSNFSLILDANGSLRVGDRIQASNQPFEQKHPILLPKGHEITELIMDQYHRDHMHAGPQALLSIIRQKYWPENGKRLAHEIVKKCVLCVRSKPKVLAQIMADRVTAARAFLNVGLDFAGPIEIKHTIRGQKTARAYICIFVCFATKAIHMEPAADLSIDGFINCLKRFVARRGLLKRITSDNATNFRGTHSQLAALEEMITEEQNLSRITKYCQDHEIEWKFSPQKSSFQWIS